MQKAADFPENAPREKAHGPKACRSPVPRLEALVPGPQIGLEGPGGGILLDQMHEGGGNVPGRHRRCAPAPGLKLVLTELEVDALPAKMGSGEIDVVVSNDNVPAHYPRQVLLQEEYVCVAAKGSRFARGTHTLERIAAQPHVVVSPRKANLVGSADTWFQAQGLRRETILSAPHFLLIPDIVVATGALAFIPSRLLPDARLTRVALAGKIRPPGFELIAA